MLPARSLTTKVLNSRMLTVFSAIAFTHRSLNAQTKRQVAGDADRTADRRRDEVLLAGDDADERVAVAGQDAGETDGIPADNLFAALAVTTTTARALPIFLSVPAAIIL